ncbi:putative IQ motif, EF-hand binding, BAG domain, BAG domain superfamily [Helianthus anomalus]
MLKDSAALKIHKLFSSFLVRKSVKKIASIRNEVSNIERRINDTIVVSLICRDAKERLRVNETLMSLIFKLDSIRGVDSGIRDLRKAVTKKEIALQEKVDSIAYQTLDLNSPGEIDSPDNVCTCTLDQVIEVAKGNRVILEDLRSDNEKIMKLMSQISQRNGLKVGLKIWFEDDVFLKIWVRG